MSGHAAALPLHQSQASQLAHLTETGLVGSTIQLRFHRDKEWPIMPQQNPSSVASRLRKKTFLQSLMLGCCLLAVLFGSPTRSAAQNSAAIVPFQSGRCLPDQTLANFQGGGSACLALRALSIDLDPISNETANAKRLIQQLMEQNKSLTDRVTILDQNVKSLSDSLDALSARVQKVAP